MPQGKLVDRQWAVVHSPVQPSPVTPLVCRSGSTCRCPTGELRTDGTTIIDFIITNIGTDPIKLPSSVALFDAPFEALTLWVTSAGIQDQYVKDAGSFKIEIVGISAELDGRSNDSKSFTLLAPTKSFRVRASSPQLKTGTNSFPAHAVLSQITDTNKLVGTADSVAITTTLVAAKSNSL